MIRIALFLFGGLGVLEALGARASAGVLSGTLFHSGEAVVALIYLPVYFAATVLGPPMLVAGVASWALRFPVQLPTDGKEFRE